MMEQRNRVVRVSRFGDPGGLEVVGAPLPIAGRAEVRVRVLASSLNYTEVLIRRHLYPQTIRLRPPKTAIAALYAALKPGGLLCVIGFSASVQAQRRMLPIVTEIARLYMRRLLPGGKRARFYSVNAMRARHPTWFKEDLERLFGLLATGPSGRASPSGSPSTRSPRLTAASRRAVSRASSSCARTFARRGTVSRLGLTRRKLPRRRRL
jgi:NADPH:quinone reductase-like Zn-dependent oxidoreductase